MARTAHPRGMTLVEVLVASIILGLGVAGLMAAATQSMRNQQRNEQRATALYLAQAKLAEVDLVGAHVWMLARPTSGAEDLEGVTYAWSLAIKQRQVGELFDVQVRVQWSGRGSGVVELGTWLNDYPAKAATAAQPGGPQGNPANQPSGQ